MWGNPAWQAAYRAALSTRFAFSPTSFAKGVVIAALELASMWLNGTGRRLAAIQACIITSTLAQTPDSCTIAPFVTRQLERTAAQPGPAASGCAGPANGRAKVPRGRGRVPRLTGRVFVSGEVVVRVGFAAARARLANMNRADTLQTRSADAYDSGFARMLRVGPSPVISRLARAEFRDLVVRDESGLLTLRWQATSPAGSLFPVLDADITVTPHAEDAVIVRLDVSYRPPLGALGAGADRALLHRAAAATIRAFVTSICDGLARPCAADDRA
jgi:hypothetical protein